jgi:hypothetical protein
VRNRTVPTATPATEAVMAVTDSTLHPANAIRPRLQRNKTSTGHNAVMREIIRPWADLASTPPGCRAVSFSSWTRFSSDNCKASSADLKASVLCAGTGTKPDFDPPLLERVYLGVDQPMACAKSGPLQCDRTRIPRPEGGSVSSWETTTSGRTMTSTPACNMMTSTEPIAFRKIEIRASPSPSSSLLTESLVRASPLQAQELQKPYITEVSQCHYIFHALSSVSQSQVSPRGCNPDLDTQAFCRSC